MRRWDAVSKAYHNPEGEVTIAIGGKYTGLKDAYKSLIEALTHGGMANHVRVKIDGSVAVVTGAGSGIGRSIAAGLAAAGALKKLIEDARAGRVAAADVDEESLRRYLYDPETPDPDLVIRTAGEMRLSNFLLWQLSYSEFYITPKFWPDFGKQDLRAAIAEFHKRERRFGGIQ